MANCSQVVEKTLSILEHQRDRLQDLIEQSEIARAVLPHVEKALDEAKEAKRS